MKPAHASAQTKLTTVDHWEGGELNRAECATFWENEFHNVLA